MPLRIGSVPPTGLALALSLAAAGRLPAQAAPAARNACEVGARVVDRQDREGTVVEAKAADCRVRLEDGTIRYYLAWMLTPARKGAQAAGGAAAGAAGEAADDALPLGAYRCVAAGGVAGTLRLVIRSASEYADRNGRTGRYAFDPASRKIAFQSGPWADFHGARLGPRKIGLASRPGGYYGTVCDLP